MSGPKTPHGYAPIFHDALAAITIDSPAELDIDTGKHPVHLRSQFNQFRQSWINQAAIHHKRKEFQEEKACRQNYYRLMQYECRLTATGIILAARGNDAAKMTIRGKANISIPIDMEKVESSFTPGKGLIKVKSLEGIPKWDGKQQDAEVAAALGIKPVEKPAPIITDNPPSTTLSKPARAPATPEEHAFFMVYSRLPKNWEELDKYNKGEAIE